MVADAPSAVTRKAVACDAAGNPFCVQVFAAVQRYRFPPGAAFVLKKSSRGGQRRPGFHPLGGDRRCEIDILGLRFQVHLRLRVPWTRGQKQQPLAEPATVLFDTRSLDSSGWNATRPDV